MDLNWAEMPGAGHGGAPASFAAAEDGPDLRSAALIRMGKSLEWEPKERVLDQANPGSRAGILGAKCANGHGAKATGGAG